jgi:hypothetical protein
MLQKCAIDPDRLAPFEYCIDTFGCEDVNPGSEWAWNIISTKAVAYSCGALCRRGDVINHQHDVGELELCKRLASELADLMADVETDYLFPEEGSQHFLPYYCVAHTRSYVPNYIVEDMIRTAFGGTIYPPAKITIHPLARAVQTWISYINEQRIKDEKYRGLENSKASYLEEFQTIHANEPWSRDVAEQEARIKEDLALDKFQQMVKWFEAQEDLHDPVFVTIGEEPLDKYEGYLIAPFIGEEANGGSSYPMLIVGLTKAGSLVGVTSYVVYT